MADSTDGFKTHSSAGPTLSLPFIIFCLTTNHLRNPVTRAPATTGREGSVEVILSTINLLQDYFYKGHL